MKNFFQIALITILTIASVNVLVSCGPKGNSGEAPAPLGATTPTIAAGQKAPEATGTSDSGGGTGVDGKVFDSYIVIPTQLPAFKDNLATLLNNIKLEKDDGYKLEFLFSLKTWYIAPIELEKISKDTLGVSFMKSDTQQIARQTAKAIWIDKRIYDKMTSREQAELLLHELVMTIYLFKYMPISEFCRITLMTSPDKKDESCVTNGVALDKMMPPETAHALTDKDYENIGFVTGWLLGNAAGPISYKDFSRVLFFNGFDKRLFNPENNASKENRKPDMKMSRKNFFQMLKGAELTGNMPDICLAITSDKKKHCKVEVVENQILVSTFPNPGINIRVTVENEEPINLGFITGEEVTLWPAQEAGGITLYSTMIIEWSNKIKIGDRLHSGFLFFKKESLAPEAPLVLDSLIMRPGIVVSIDKKRNQICQLRSPKATGFSDDGLAIRRDNSALSMIEQYYTTSEPFAACNEFNVVE